LWVGIGGSEKNRLWCVANGMSGKQRYSKSSKWPPSARIHASSIFRHWSTASVTTLCWNSAHSVSRIGTRYSLKMKKKHEKFVHFKRSVVTFSGMVGKGVTVVFFWDNVNNLKYVSVILLKWLFGFPEVKWLQYTGEVGKCTC